MDNMKRWVSVILFFLGLCEQSQHDDNSCNNPEDTAQCTTTAIPKKAENHFKSFNYPAQQTTANKEKDNQSY